jgi:hypothetical protein
LSEKHRLRDLDKRVLRRIFGPKRDEMIEVRENRITGISITCTLWQV